MLSRRLKEVERSAAGLARREAQVADREGRLAACQQQLQASQDQLARQVGLKSADFQGHATKCRQMCDGWQVRPAPASCPSGLAAPLRARCGMIVQRVHAVRACAGNLV